MAYTTEYFLQPDDAILLLRAW